MKKAIIMFLIALIAVGTAFAEIPQDDTFKSRIAIDLPVLGNDDLFFTAYGRGIYTVVCMAEFSFDTGISLNNIDMYGDSFVYETDIRGCVFKYNDNGNDQWVNFVYDSEKNCCAYRSLKNEMTLNIVEKVAKDRSGNAYINDVEKIKEAEDTLRLMIELYRPIS